LILRLRQTTIGIMTSRRWTGFMVMALRDEGKN
jgi:hypothetical protein